MPRPELPPGAQRELVDTLHLLHHEAGWPSLRRLAREAGCSHTTVSAAFSAPRLPSWGLLELLVRAMGGDVGEFHRLWLAASSPAAPNVAAPAIAGRGAELAVVKRHLASGSGMLLVTGEAGIGKTRLADTAVRSVAEVFVAAGSCLPLSAQVPLLPVTDVLRSIREVADGRWFERAVGGCPPYVAASLARLLPELDQGPEPAATPDDPWWHQRLFSAVGAALSALAETKPLAVLIEDLHWADPTTLDLVEHLLVRSGIPPLLATYRPDDPSTPSATGEWFDRVRRQLGVTTLELGPLTRAETASLVELAGASLAPEEVDRVHRRSGGLPLFAEQLAMLQPGEDVLPSLLGDLLDRRLAGLGGDTWAIARALGIADRPLSAAELCSITGLTPAGLTGGLHRLRDRGLVGTAGDGGVRLRHPLFAEAVRRRLVPGEAEDEHRRLARVLAEAPDPSAGEIAEHWRQAGDDPEEIGWRMRAARAAGARFAAAQEADQWRRVLDLWPVDVDSVGEPPLRRVDAYVAAIEALQGIDWPAAAGLADEAVDSVDGTAGPRIVDLWLCAGEAQGNVGNPEAGIALVDRALDAEVTHRDPTTRARALLSRASLLSGLDRIDEAVTANAQAIEAARVADPVIHRRALLWQAAHSADTGRLEEALAHIGTAARVQTRDPDPVGDVRTAVFHTHILLIACRSADDVREAGRPGLSAAAAWGIDDFLTSVLLGNISSALRRAGRVPEAAAVIDPATEGAPEPHRWPTYSERGILDLLRGRAEEATRLLDAVSGTFVVDPANRAECARDLPTVDLWCGRARSAYDRLVAALRELTPVEDSAVDTAGLLVLAARAAADVAEAPAGSASARHEMAQELQGLLAGAARDPFGGPASYADRPALRATWTAELARLAGRPSLERWVGAAAAWDAIGRPHDSAYCRWRGARVATATGQAGVAAKLLRRAERDAREHVPLLALIRAS
ncbi:MULTISPECIES: ATP-binding protein [unclassified Nocardioides]|uniref:ATP-binding protein n=1 Tax=unclassified Nocardioides TaxID=2615069 RepID=UPI00360B45B2